MNKLAVGYCRVSTEAQAIEGMSIETQRKRIEEYCKLKQWNLIKIYEDAGISGGTMDRPGIQLLKEELKSDTVVIITDISRLGRNLYDALQFRNTLKETGSELACISGDLDFTTPVGNMLFNILMSVSEMERANISKHVSANMDRLKSENRLRTKAPFGYKFIAKDEHCIKDTEQQEVLKLIFELHRQGYSIMKICKTLNEWGFNKCIINNKIKKDKIPLFGKQMIKHILMEHNIIPIPEGVTIIPLEQRLKCHHGTKTSDDISDLLT